MEAINEPMRPVLYTPCHADLGAYRCALGASMMPYEISHSVPTDEWTLSVPCSMHHRADLTVWHVTATRIEVAECDDECREVHGA